MIRYRLEIGVCDKHKQHVAMRTQFVQINRKAHLDIKQLGEIARPCIYETGFFQARLLAEWFDSYVNSIGTRVASLSRSPTDWQALTCELPRPTSHISQVGLPRNGSKPLLPLRRLAGRGLRKRDGNETNAGKVSKQPIGTRYLGHVTSYQPIRDQYFLIRSVSLPRQQLNALPLFPAVDTTDKGTIAYPDFLIMMLGGKNSVLRMILLFEEKAKPKPKPAGIAKKMSLADLGIRPDMAQHLG
eukprot:sb/3468978/